ncbi:Rapid ALkalinization Factor, partial [Arabidopsis thaliana x Arabidopsis arenosa]
IMKAQVFMFVTVLIFVGVFISSTDAIRYIIYPPVHKHPNGCDPRFPTPACYKRTPENPYRRGCSCINRCRRENCGPNRVSSLKKFLDKVLEIPV